MQRTVYVHLGAEPTFKSEEEVADHFNDYVDFCDQNPIKKPELIKSGMAAGEQVDLKMPRPVSVAGFCIHLGISRVTWYEWKKTGRYPNILPRIEDFIFRQQVDGAQCGIYNAGISARRLKLAEHTILETPDLKGYEILK